MAETLVGDVEWVCKTLNWTKDAFGRSKNKKLLSDAGFPKKDAILKGWVKADVIDWINQRRQILDSSVLSEDTTPKGINKNAL